MRMFQPILSGARLPDRLLACLGAALGIAVTIVTCSLFVQAPLPAIVAPLGASAVLVFAVPSSPLAQPWSVIGGNTLSALVGIAMFRFIPDPALSAAAAVGGAILIMSLCRCLHPPGGAAALTAVIGGDAVHHAGYGFALLPVGVNSLALVLIGIGFHRLTIHRYPRRAVTPPTGADTRFAPSDIDLALRDMHETFDIDRQDLEALLAHAERHALDRRIRRRARDATPRRHRATQETPAHISVILARGPSPSSTPNMPPAANSVPRLVCLIVTVPKERFNCCREVPGPTPFAVAIAPAARWSSPQPANRPSWNTRLNPSAQLA